VKRVFTPFNVMTLILLAASAFAYYQVQLPPPEATVPDYGNRAEVQEAKLRLYFSDSQVQQYATEERALSVRSVTPGALGQAAVDALADGPTGSGLAVLPKSGDKPRVWARGEHYVVDLPASYAKLNYGASGERMVLCSITNTLLGVKDMKDVTFLVAGRNTESLLGHMDLRSPFTREDCAL